uniref:Family with sequence similarity 107 member A n=1 Tax=Molossus molossus TaxID=27622 RepID=A0A7J8DBD3_MOLMO|nr:family with sequence similarity 107 member A [Molossus molossus]
MGATQGKKKEYYPQAIFHNENEKQRLNGSEADGGDTVWRRPQQPAQDSPARTSTALTDAIQYPGQLQGGL